MSTTNSSLKRFTLIVFLAASINLGWQFYRAYQQSVASELAYQKYGYIVCSFGPSRDEIARMYIELLMLVALIAVHLRGLKGTLLSAFGLSGALLIYLRWWDYYFLLGRLGPGELTFVRHSWYLYRASYLDIAIFGGIAVLIFCHVRNAMYSFFDQPGEIIGE